MIKLIAFAALALSLYVWYSGPSETDVAKMVAQVVDDRAAEHSLSNAAVKRAIEREQMRRTICAHRPAMTMCKE